MLTFRKFLVEKIVGNTGWVYHRTQDNPEESDIVTQGIKPSINQSAMYGRGLYCCYDLDQQLKPEMEKYGDYILKGKIDLNGFATLDEDIYQLANPKGNFSSHLRKIGTDIENVKDETPYTSSIAQNIWKECKQNGYNGIIFTGRNDGKVAVIWNRRNFIPYQYSKDNGVTWKKLKPDIKAIKRPFDPEYDDDDETIKFSKILKRIQNKEEIGDLIVPENFNGILYLKNLKKCGDIYAARVSQVDLPQLQISKDLILNYADEINLPQLKTSGGIYVSGVRKLNLPQLQESGPIHAGQVTEINFPQLQKNGGFNTQRAIELNLPKLQTSGFINAERAIKVNIPELKELIGYIAFHNLKELNLPQLQTVKDISAIKSTIINLPQLQTVRDIFASGVIEINLPQLQQGRNIHVEKALTVIIPRKFMENNAKNVKWDAFKDGFKFIHPDDNPEIKVDENVTFKKYLMLKESLVQIPLDSAYEIFKNEYDKSTGTSWTYDKFMGRARNWEFYGDEKGYVAIRRQRSGLVKLVGMAGDNRSKLKGINDLISMKMPLWGMVSKDIKDISVRRGMREPNFLERQVLKRSIPPEVLGGAEILEYQKDGGIKLQYPDVGVVVKYLVGTPEYYAKLRTMLGDKVKEKILG
jgi:hypothetical protein